MSNKRKKIDEINGQASIFDLLKPDSPPAHGSMNIDVLLRHAISEAIRACGKDRYDICAAISKLTGVEVSKYALDSWSAESRAKSSDNLDLNGNKRWGIPAELLSAFCQVVEDWRPLFIVVEAANFKALKGKDIVHAKLGKVIEEMKRLDAEKKRLQKALVEAVE